MSIGSRLVCLAGLVLVAACGSGPDSSAPVATPSAVLSRTQVPLGAPVDITYRFVVSPDAPAFEADYRVLVHFLDADQELMWTDDHDSPVPTRTWKPGQTIEYTRTMFVPIYPYIGAASLNVGLYESADQRRLSLAGEDSGQKSYGVATFELLPQSENVFLIYEEGWHPSEIAEDNAMVEWQWTEREAVIAFRNPRADSLLYLQLDGRPDHFEEPQTVTVQAGETVLDEFQVTSSDRLLRRVSLSAAQLGDDDMVRIRLLVDQGFVPAQLAGSDETDERLLGVRVFHAFIEPQ